MGKLFQTKLALVFVASLLSGCASSGFGDLFSGYSQQMSSARQAQLRGNFALAEQQVPVRYSSDGTYALSQLELARLQYLNNEWKKSQTSFTNAYEKIQSEEDKANLQISRGFEQVGAVVSNDNALRYDVPHYEQSMLHTYQAINYLKQQGLESALVEVRRANMVQENALKAYQGELDKAQRNMDSYGISAGDLSGSYPSMVDTIGSVKNGIQNAYTFYLSGVLYEAAGEPNDAYIDYKKALEIFPDNQYLQRDVIRLAKRLGMTDDLAKFKNQLGSDVLATQSSTGTGNVVFIYEQGVIEAKEEVSINLPIRDRRRGNTIMNLSLPVYRGYQMSASPLVVENADEVFESQAIVDLHALAAKQLDDQLSGLIVRQLLRLFAKEKMRRQIADEAGDFGNILATLYNVASERADTRSWSTLPSNVHILRMDLAPGEHQIKLRAGASHETITIKVNENRITLVNLTHIGNYTGYQDFNL